jgi:hypothetical protein
MAIRLRKKSNVGKSILNGEYAFGNVKVFLKEKLLLTHHKHVLRYKFFYTKGKTSYGDIKCKSLYFVRNNIVVNKFSLEEINSYNISTENIIMYLQLIGVEEIVNIEEIFENYKL